METKASPLTRAMEAAKAAMGPQRYLAGGKPVACPVCGHDRFEAGDYIGLLLVHTLVCEACGLVLLFKKRPEWIKT